MIFTSVDYDKFRALRVTHVATRFEELINDEANDDITPEKLFLIAVDDALEARRVNKIDKLIRRRGSPSPGPRSPRSTTAKDAGSTRSG